MLRLPKAAVLTAFTKLESLSETLSDFFNFIRTGKIMLIEGVFWSQTIVVAVFNSFSTIYSSSALDCSSVVKRTERSLLCQILQMLHGWGPSDLANAPTYHTWRSTWYQHLESD